MKKITLFITLFSLHLSSLALPNNLITLRYDTAANIHALKQNTLYSTGTRNEAKQQTIRSIAGQPAHISFEKISPFLAEIPSHYDSGVYRLISSKTGFTVTVTEQKNNHDRSNRF